MDETSGRSFRRIGLVGCVKQKASQRLPARDLYTSALYVGRRAHVERTCDEWWLLSAEHGLVHPDMLLDRYDAALRSRSVIERREWAQRVLVQVDEKLALLPGDIVEIHAGAEYRSEGLVDGLRQRGVLIENPTEGLPIGRQLSFYASGRRSDSRATDSRQAESRPGHSRPARSRPADLRSADPQPAASSLPRSRATEPRLTEPRAAASRAADLDRLYDLIGELSERCGGMRRLADCTGGMGWPRRGVYFFFEDGELRPDGLTPRIVRVGTHGLSASKSTLWGRLRQHRGTVGGANSPGGNHRGSIFRLHVGTALIAIRDWPESVRSQWGVGQNAPAEIRAGEQPLEAAVSAVIGAMPFLWLDVDDEPDRNSARGTIERNTIGLLSTSAGGGDPASPRWLGRSAARPAIRRSSLWNVNHVDDSYDASFFDVLAAHIRLMGS